ncbi:flagellar hook protein FlgE [Pseudoruegeria sp. SK021]|uniref:flagellar hook protein FlgE n=1 Tax=Pseudoruegeria sp. SK021 TaxID=1933035 RepID=UPI000A23EFD5|nr:flagellar hook-basal body complex protein [Pseudoruegeria sp. SK021]OSP54665.1 flagellar biosynthesis protein FlgE [Pseudoruegeria sp. SK021]
MTISSSLNAAVMGLSANANKLASISDNIANSSTYGYKRVETDFYSMVNAGASGSYSAGGVRTTTQRLIDETGALIGTSNSTDIAVDGRGMVPVTSESAVKSGSASLPMLLTTTGSYRMDAAGYLKSEAGLILMGWPAAADGTIPNYPRDTSDGLEPIKINTNQFVGEPTTKMNIGVNLPATATKPGAAGVPESITVEYFDNLGTSEKINATFTPTIPAVGATVPSNEWTMQITDTASPGAILGEYVITFNDTRTLGGTVAAVTTTSGGAYNPLTGSMQVNVASGPIDIAIGLPGDPNGLTQLSNTFAPVTISKDGAATGNLVEVEIDPNGFVHALFDNGTARTLYQVPLADIPNPNGLMALDNQTFQVSHDSGSFFLWNAGNGPTGDIVGFAREESTTDVANELTDLIQTQRAYSSNAKVIQTVDEMLQETTNIKR